MSISRSVCICFRSCNLMRCRWLLLDLDSIYIHQFPLREDQRSCKLLHRRCSLRPNREPTDPESHFTKNNSPHSSSRHFHVLQFTEGELSETFLLPEVFNYTNCINKIQNMKTPCNEEGLILFYYPNHGRCSQCVHHLMHLLIDKM